MPKHVNKKIDYIYSRPRIKLKMVRLNNKKINALIKIIAIALIGYFFARNIINFIRPTINIQCLNQAKIIANGVINKHTENVMNEFKYEELVQINKDEKGAIQFIKLNVNPVNEIASKIATNIQNDLNENNSTRISLRAGSLLGIETLSGVGPKIHIKLATAGNVESNIKSKFVNSGINQTLHQIYLEIKCKIIIYSPYDTITDEVVNQIIIAESIIVGEIPNGYYNIKDNENTMVYRNAE